VRYFQTQPNDLHLGQSRRALDYSAVLTMTRDFRPPDFRSRWSFFGLVAAGAATVVLVCDELLKVFVRASLPVCDVSQLEGCARLDVVGQLRLVRAENAGSALGYAQGSGVWVLLAALGLLLIPLYARKLRTFGALGALAAGLQAAGALGNLLDRVVLGGATDMLTFAPALIWNIADVALAVGTLLATALLVRAAVLDPP
jgi:signal peptidase II